MLKRVFSSALTELARSLSLLTFNDPMYCLKALSERLILEKSLRTCVPLNELDILIGRWMDKYPRSGLCLCRVNCIPSMGL